MRKVYEVEFIQYTNTLNDTVSDGEKYIDVSRDPFLIFEDEIEKYKSFGHGIKSLRFVGNMNV